MFRYIHIKKQIMDMQNMLMALAGLIVLAIAVILILGEWTDINMKDWGRFSTWAVGFTMAIGAVASSLFVKNKLSGY